MIREKIITLNKINLQIIYKFIALLSVVFIAPFFHNQIITGTIVNASLFIAVTTINPIGAILIGLLPSTVALFTGTLPIFLVPMLPIIMLSNVLLILIFNYTKKLNYWTSISISGLTKFLFLFFSSSLILTSDLTIINSSFGIIQLITTLFGGTLAYFLIKK